MAMTQLQQQEYDAFLRNNPNDAGRASSALGFDTTSAWVDPEPPYTPPPSAPPQTSTPPPSAPPPAPNPWNSQNPAPTDAGMASMIARDRGSWEKSLREAAQRFGVGDYGSELDDVIRSLQYASNAGTDPKIYLDQAIAKLQRRGRPTLSGGGPSGGDWDRNGDGRRDMPSPSTNPTTLGTTQQPGFGGGAGRQMFNGFGLPGEQFSDPYTKLLEQIAQEQLTALRQPQTNPALDRFLSFLDTRFSDLTTNPGYGPDELALLRTQALEPIEQDRTASQRRSLERTAARGMLPSSGLTELDSREVDTHYDRIRGGVQRDLGINALARRDQDLDRAMGIGQIAGLQIPQMQRTEDAQRRNELMQTAGVLYNLPRQAMYDSLAVVNGSPAPGDLFGNAVQLMNANQNTRYMNQQQDAAFWAAIGDLSGWIFG